MWFVVGFLQAHRHASNYGPTNMVTEWNSNHTYLSKYLNHALKRTHKKILLNIILQEQKPDWVLLYLPQKSYNLNRVHIPKTPARNKEIYDIDKFKNITFMYT